MKRYEALARHPLAIAGALITTASAVVFIALLIAQFAGLFANPYAGLVVFIALPAIFVIGLLMIPAGMWLEQRRLLRDPTTPTDWPVINLNIRRVRGTVLLFTALTAANIVIILVAGYEPTGVAITPSLAVPAAKDRDGEDVFAPDAASRTFTTGRINWFGRDPDWTDTLGFRGRQDVESRAGEWTRLEVTCRGRSLTVRVNGVIVNAGTGASLSSGRIMLQSEGAEIFFRRVELSPLDDRD